MSSNIINATFKNQTFFPKLVKPFGIDMSSSRTNHNFKSMFLSEGKVEKILKGILDSIPSHSPSVKIQIKDRKVPLRCKGKTLLGVVNKLLNTKSWLTMAQLSKCLK